MNCSKLINIVMIVLAGCLFIVACATIGVWAKQYSKPKNPNNNATKTNAPKRTTLAAEPPHKKTSGPDARRDYESGNHGKEIVITGDEADDNTIYDSVIGCSVTLMLLAVCQMVVCFMRILTKLMTFLIWAILNSLIFVFYIVCFGILCDRLKIFSFIGFFPAGSNLSATDKQIFKQTADTGKALCAFCGVCWMFTFGGIIGVFFVGHKKVEKPPEPEDREVEEKRRKKSSKLYLQQPPTQRKSQGEEVPTRPQQKRISQGDPLKPKPLKEKEHHKHHKGHHQKA